MHDGERIRPGAEPRNSTDPRIRLAIEMMSKEDLSRPIRVDKIVARLNISVSRFRHLFKKELGLSPRQFVKSLRLDRAKQLLEDSFLEVKEVASQVGFTDISHFARDYKAAHDETPSQTRLRAKNSVSVRD
jgi:AraC family transcriptional regulator of arabinose operon